MTYLGQKRTVISPGVVLVEDVYQALAPPGDWERKKAELEQAIERERRARRSPLEALRESLE